VIPEFEPVPSEPVDPAQLRTLTAQEWNDGFDSNLAYFPVCDYEWDTAERALAVEAAAIDGAAAAAATPEDFEATLEAVGDSDAWDFGGLDVGVTGLVFALQAAGFRTSNSCRGHPRFGLPFVRTVLDAVHLDFLLPRVEEAGCTVMPTPDGQVEIFGVTVRHLVRLGEILARDKAAAAEIGFVDIPGEIEDEM